jgi:uncharacterized membrane protein
MSTSDYENWSGSSRKLVLLCFFGLPVVFTLSLLVVPGCGRQPSTVIWLLHMLPLLLFVVGVIRQNVRTHVWLCFVMLGYFLLAVQNIFVCQSLLSAIEVALIVVLFISAMMYIRWRSRALAATDFLE